MAKMVPKEFPYQHDPKRWAEFQTYRAFENLDESWCVFYGVAWQAQSHGRQRDGECDFVLLHPRHGLYAVEVKGGSEIGVIDGEWYTTKAGKRISLKQSPFSQAVKSKNVLKDYLEDGIQSFQANQPIGHFVVFPSHTQEGNLTAEAPREIICDTNDLASFTNWFPSLLAHWNISVNYSADLFESVKSRLAPTATLKNSLSVRVRTSERALVELTEGQFTAMEIMRRHRRTLTLGGAGTGKTLLAKARAESLAKSGFRTLLVCFNRPLGELLADDLEDPLLTVGSFHSICFEVAERAKLLPDGERNEGWWDTELPLAFEVGAEVLDIKYDAIIVDEGQDFHPDWWTALFDVLSDRSDAIFAVFADSNQNIYREKWIPPFDVDPFELNVNCRNTIEIAARFTKLAGTTTETKGTHGIHPTVKIANTDNQVAKAVRASVKLFLDEARVSPADMVVLVNRKSELELAQAELQDIGGAAAKIPVETIQRFKGLEATAAIVILRTVDSLEFDPLVYVGLSRARSLLHIICTDVIAERLNEICE